MESNDRSFFRVVGGNPISGKIKPQGNKNEALPLLAACLLTSEETILSNIPPIEDVKMMIDVITSLGVKVERIKEDDPTRIRVLANGELESRLPVELASKLRGCVTLAGPLLARTGHVFLPRPGGDRIGRRRMDTHILAFKALGAKVKIFPDGYDISCDKLKGADILLDEASVTATENIVCAATLADGITIIRNAASEPHVQGLCRFLNAMGAQITGIGSNTIQIKGVDGLKGAPHRIGPDYLEVGSFMALAAITGGELLIEDADIENMRMIRMVFARMGIISRVENDALLVPPDQSLEIINDLGGAIPKVESATWPGFPADMTSVALVAATQCTGTLLLHEKLFESRLFFTDRLISMGARIVLCDPHRAVIMGPATLTGQVVSSPDIRAGMAMLIAALCAQGESIIHNIIQIDRGFSNIDVRLRSLGASIERVTS